MLNSLRSLVAASFSVAAAFAQVCPVVRVVVLQDQTGSVNWTRTPTVRYEDLVPLVDLVKQCSGEVAFGLIRDSSNRGLIRLVIESPVPPELQPPASWSLNPFIANRERAAFEQKKQLRDRERQAWAATHNPLVEAFRGGVVSLLKTSADARRTDLYGALRRADSFLAEDPRAWHREVYMAAIVISDGLDNKHNAVPEWRSKAQILAVNSEDSIGDLGRLYPPARRFESIQAAVRDFVVGQPRSGP